MSGSAWSVKPQSCHQLATHSCLRLANRQLRISLTFRPHNVVPRASRHCIKAQVAMDVDFPPYTIISKGLHYDLRFYDVYKVVRMPYERRDEGYIGLGAYFDGENEVRLRLRQTQPVVMRFMPAGMKTMELYVGRDADGSPVDRAPQPLDRRLSIEAAGGEIAAVLRFEGSATREATESAVSKLRAALEQNGLGCSEDAAAFRLAQYGPLNSLSTRLNEVMVRVKM